MMYMFSTLDLIIWSGIMIVFGLGIGQWWFDDIQRAFILRMLTKKNYGVIRMFMGDQSEISTVADMGGSIIKYKNRAYYNDKDYVYFAEDYDGNLGANEMGIIAKYYDEWTNGDEETKKKLSAKIPIIGTLFAKAKPQKQRVKTIRTLFGVPILYYNYESATPIDIKSGGQVGGYDNPEKIATALETDIEAEVMDRLAGAEKRRDMLLYLALGGIVLIIGIALFMVRPELGKIEGLVIQLVKAGASQVK